MSTTAEQDFRSDALGQWSDPLEFEVTRERIVAYAQATNDDIPQHAEGRFAPPVFAVVPAFEALTPAMIQMIPPEKLMMVVHGEQDFRFHRPIEPGMRLVTRVAPLGFQPRSSGVTAVAKAESRTGEGDLVVEQYMTSFVRGAQTAQGSGEPPPEHGFPERLRGTDPLAETAQTFDRDQTYRYSDASGDKVPLHLDDDVARAVGLPGIIIHGLCTMAFTSRAVIQAACPDDPARLRRLAVRFSKPAFPGQTITTRIWRADEGGGHEAYAYETTADSGDVVIKDGLAEIAG
jgi:acyl dehydratase